MKRIDKDFTAFEKALSIIHQDLTTHSDAELKPVMKRLSEILNHNVRFGKKLRGFAVVKTFKLFASKEELTPENIFVSQMIGWCLEIMQSVFLILDDIMDHSTTRRGQQCWYLKDKVGVLAINDASLLSFSLYKIFKKYCSEHSCYKQILDVYYSSKFFTFFGQVTETLTTPEDSKPKFELFNRQRYAAIVKYKTSIYSFVTPVKIGLYLAKVTDEEIHQKAEALLLRIGRLFQVQDDYLDVYGDPEVTGKTGTDIEGGKCSWIAVEAYRVMNDEERRMFEDNYGVKNRISVQIVKHLFSKLEMQKVFENFERNENKAIQKMIFEFRSFNINVEIFEMLLHFILKRKK